MNDEEIVKLKLAIGALIATIYDEWPKGMSLLDIVNSSSRSDEQMSAMRWLVRSPYFPQEKA